MRTRELHDPTHPIRLCALLSALFVAPAIGQGPPNGGPPGPPTEDVRIVEGQIEVVALPEVQLAAGSSLALSNSAANPVAVSLVSSSDSLLPAQLLPPGGRTIGGPGRFDAAVDEDAFIIGGFTNTSPRLMCYTFINLGPGGFSIFGFGHPAGDFQDVMFAGEEETHCGLVSGVRITCNAGGGACEGIYRVDLVD